MGRRGPAPTPTKLKILRGNPGKRAINRAEPVPPPGEVQAPDFVVSDPTALEFWTWVVGASPAGLLTPLDRAGLALAAQTWSLWRAALRDGQGPQAAKLGHQLRALLGEFGLTPASRSRVTLTDEKGTETWRDQLFRA